MDHVKQKILAIFKHPQLGSLATITEDGKPWVRYVMCMADEELKIRMATFVNARKAGQIKHNPEVHLTCGVTGLTEMNPYLQIQGHAKISTDEKEKKKFWNDSLGKIFKGPNDPNYGVIIITAYRIELCSPGSFEPEIWQS